MVPPSLVTMADLLVQAVSRWNCFPILWAVLDILCKDTDSAPAASTVVAQQIIKSSFKPWRLLWCFSKMAQQATLLALCMWHIPGVDAGQTVVAYTDHFLHNMPVGLQRFA